MYFEIQGKFSVIDGVHSVEWNWLCFYVYCDVAVILRDCPVWISLLQEMDEQINPFGIENGITRSIP